MITGARCDWPQYLCYKTCVPKFHNSGRDVEKVNGSVGHDITFGKVVEGALCHRECK